MMWALLWNLRHTMKDRCLKPILDRCPIIRPQPTCSLRGAYADDRRAVGLFAKILNHGGQAPIPESGMSGKPPFQNLVCCNLLLFDVTCFYLLPFAIICCYFVLIVVIRYSLLICCYYLFLFAKNVIICCYSSLFVVICCCL